VSEAPNPAAELDAAVRAHADRLPEPTRGLLMSAIAPDAPDPWVRDALLAYCRLWIRRFEREEPRETAEAALADELCAVVGRERTGDDDADVTAAETGLASGFGQRGYAFLGGRTPPELGAYIWSRTEEKRFTVALPRDDPQEVTVHLMHAFLIRGWLHWRTLGEQGAGGWYQQDNPPWADGLYAVAERYPEPRETNPAFTVSLLGHEAQHVADHHAFPGLGSGELEYRAKLVELIGFTSAEERLAFFLTDAANDPSQPHPWAAHRIVADLAARLPTAPADSDAWLAVPYGEVRRLALELLDADTARRLRPS
jgi:hypothetical protein